MRDLTLSELAVTVVVAGIVLFLFFPPLRRSPVEAGLTPAYEERCTGRNYLGLGLFGTFLTWRVSFYDSFIVVGSILRKVIPYSSVKAVEYKGFLGLVIHSENPKSTLVLYPRQPKKMLDILGNKGISITRNL